MRKCIWLAVLLLVILPFAGIARIRAEILPAQGEGQIGYQAVVLCESLTVRQERSAGSKVVETLHYGDTFAVQDNWDGWASCFTSDDVDAGQTGWVNSDYIIVNPTWYRTDDTTPVYAWNDTMAPKVALLSKGTVLPILKDEGEWLIVSLRGASGWICKSASDRLTAETVETIRLIANLDRAELTTPKGTYTLSDQAGLRWIEENFSIAQPIVSAGCPFDGLTQRLRFTPQTEERLSSRWQRTAAAISVLRMGAPLLTAMETRRSDCMAVRLGLAKRSGGFSE